MEGFVFIGDAEIQLVETEFGFLLFLSVATDAVLTQKRLKNRLVVGSSLLLLSPNGHCSGEKNRRGEERKGKTRRVFGLHQLLKGEVDQGRRRSELTPRRATPRSIDDDGSGI